MELISQCYKYLFTGALIVLGIALLVTLIYILVSKKTVDRIIGINLIGTVVVMIICILTHTMGEAYLADVAVIYVVLSFLAVMMLCRIYINLYANKKKDMEKEEIKHDF